MTKYFTLPGYGNSGSAHWQTYFESQLSNCQRIEQDSWDHPNLDAWVNRIEEVLQNEDLSHTILITHSLGGMALLHWVKRFNKTVKAAFIVAPPDLEIPYEDLGLGAIPPIPSSPLPFPSLVVGSTNDHWMSLERTQHFAQAWGSELVVLENAGHINGDSGYGQWDEGLELLKKLD